MSDNVQILVVGDGGVGKTSLLITYVTDSFPHPYIPSLADFYDPVIRKVEGQNIRLTLMDTGGGEDYDRLRPLSYYGRDIILLCFDIRNESTLLRVKEKYIPDLDYHVPTIPRILVGCKSDLRITEPNSCVDKDQTERSANALGLHYFETSSIKGHGLQTCFDKAMRLGLDYSRLPKKKKQEFYKRPPKKMIAPVKPIKEKPPTSSVEESTFAEDWLQMLNNPKYPDVIFLIEGGQQECKAHSIVLSSASELFCRIIRDQKYSGLVGTSEDTSSDKVEGIDTICCSKNNDGRNIITIEINHTFEVVTFRQLLKFLYTGHPGTILETNKIEQLTELRRAANTFKLPYLNDICYNIENSEECLNQSIGTYLNMETGKKMKEFYFNQTTDCDVKFEVEGEHITASAVVLYSRCPVFADMLSIEPESEKIESSEIQLPNTQQDSFLALLEFLYTDHAPIHDANCTELLLTADKYGILKLVNYCEIYIINMLDKLTKSSSENGNAVQDVIDALLTAQVYNAEQLTRWCLHTISTNYDKFNNTEQFSQLSDKTKKHIETHRWPPLSYLQEMEKFERRRTRRKCSIL
ncbi:rho-related protein racA-like isoform X2 [Mytilus californianus]|uniref:rho-related protein racA-like isoform X2 n=1 Tax=Mytilus californianus TaxID=6549 RepID=UPI0022460DCC|nr:rho-related protein racA-like isoform X2 [Mytilus californianus]